ncbi:MAG: hypothetical protein EOO39_43210, partial [Cytophagaceae bacterium]
MCFLPHWLVGQRIQLGEVPKTLCAGATLPVSFTVNEPFEAGNTFRIEIVNQFQQVVATATENIIPSGSFIQIPATLAPRPVEYIVRVVANKPIAVSNSAPLLFSGIPSATLRPFSTTDGSLNPGEPLNVPVALTGGGPYSLSFIDGTTRDLDDVSQATLLLYPTQSKTY